MKWIRLCSLFLMIGIAFSKAQSSESQPSSSQPPKLLYNGALKFDVLGLLRGTVQVDGEVLFLDWLGFAGSISYSNSDFDLSKALFWAETLDVKLGPRFIWWVHSQLYFSVMPHLGVLTVYPFQSGVNQAGIQKERQGMPSIGTNGSVAFLTKSGFFVELVIGINTYYFVPYPYSGVLLGWAF